MYSHEKETPPNSLFELNRERYVHEDLMRRAANGAGSMGDKVGVGNFGTGVVGRQKGAAAVFLRYNKVSLLFITSHLARESYSFIYSGPFCSLMRIVSISEEL